MASQPNVYDPADRPDVEVLWEGACGPGEVRMVKRVGGVRLHLVQYRRPGELSSHLDDFEASSDAQKYFRRTEARATLLWMKAAETGEISQADQHGVDGPRPGVPRDLRRAPGRT